MQLYLVVIVTLAAGAAAFVPSGLPRSGRRTAVAVRAGDDLAGMVAECLDDECSIETVDALISGLQDERLQLRAQLAGVEKLLESLGSANADPAAREEVNNILVEAFVKPAFRSFQKTGSRGDVGGDYPALGGPTGYSGDKRDGGDGQNTAVSRVLPCASCRPNMLPLTPPLQWKI